MSPTKASPTQLAGDERIAGEPSMTRTETALVREQSRARYPDRTGYVERDGIRVFWEQYGDGEPALAFIGGLSARRLAPSSDRLVAIPAPMGLRSDARLVRRRVRR